VLDETIKIASREGPSGTGNWAVMHQWRISKGN